jgi:hypothetical protein
MVGGLHDSCSDESLSRGTMAVRVVVREYLADGWLWELPNVGAQLQVAAGGVGLWAVAYWGCIRTMAALRLELVYCAEGLEHGWGDIEGTRVGDVQLGVIHHAQEVHRAP